MDVALELVRNVQTFCLFLCSSCQFGLMVRADIEPLCPICHGMLSSPIAYYDRRDSTSCSTVLQ